MLLIISIVKGKKALENAPTILRLLAQSAVKLWALVRKGTVKRNNCNARKK